MTHRFAPLGLRIAILAVAVLTAANATRADDTEYWYALQMQGQRAGWMHAWEKAADGKITVGSTTELRIKRGPTEIVITMDGESVETEKGKPISMRSSQKMAGDAAVTELIFHDEELEIVKRNGDQVVDRRTHPLPDGRWLPPAAAGRYLVNRLEAGDEEITIRTIDPTLGTEPVVVTRTDFEQTQIEVMGRSVPAIRCISTTQAGLVRIESVEFLGEDGTPLRTEMSLGAIKLVALAADRELALSNLDPPEMMASTLVHPDRPIPMPRHQRSATFRLKLPAEAMPDLPEAGHQRVETIEPGVARVRVDLDDVVPADDADNAEYRESSAMCDLSDTRIKELAKRAGQNAGKDPAKRAETFRRFVHEHIDEKGLGVGFASASETARTREGDCSEHATLLTALLRADGIPARTVSGLIYVDRFAGEENIFGYHMWTQALLDVDGKQRWVELDATLGSHTPFDATHIALATSSLADGATSNALLSLAPVIGQLEIEVESLD